LEDKLLEYVLGLGKDGCGVLHEMLHFEVRNLVTKRGIGHRSESEPRLDQEILPLPTDFPVPNNA
jgi:hypothetical protein